MKSVKATITLALLLLTLVTFAKDKNGWSGDKVNYKIWNRWSANLELGVTSYFGDLSQYDNYVWQKLTLESHTAFAFSLTKTWRNYDISGQIIYGGFKSDYIIGHEFKTRIFEYNFQIGIHLINMLAPYNNLRFEIKPYVGAGQFVFNTIQYGFNEGLPNGGSIARSVPEFVYFIGGRFEYEMSDRINITVNLSVRQAQNDNVDNYIKGDNFDYYTFTSVGIQYSIVDISAPFRKKRLHRAHVGMRNGR